MTTATATTDNAQYTHNLIVYWTKQYNETAYRVDKLAKEGKVEAVKALQEELVEMDGHIKNLQQELKTMVITEVAEVQPQVQKTVKSAAKKTKVQKHKVDNTDNIKYTNNMVFYWIKQYNALDDKINKLIKEGNNAETVKKLTTQLEEIADHIECLKKEIQKMLN